MPPSPTLAIKSKKILSQGWGTLTQYVFSLVHRDGSMQEHKREVYDHGNASAILLLDPERRVLTLVRQFRLPPHLLGDDGHMLEVCAGLLEGDTPADCAIKEAIEETGIRPSTLTHAFDIYASPGSVAEKTHCFIGLHSAKDRIGKGGGLDEEGEDIEIVEVGFDDALHMIETGAIVDCKTVALLQHAALKGLLNQPARVPAQAFG